MSLRPAAIGLLLAGNLASAAALGESLTLKQVLQRVVDRDISLQVAGMQIERARQETDRVESQLGWNLSGQAGAARDASQFLGTPTDRLDANAGFERRLESGSTLGLGAGATYEDSTLTFSPLLPNPVETTRLDLSYRVPLRRGADNPEYRAGLVSAAAASEAAVADWATSRDQLALRTADLFYSAALTRARLRNAQAAIDRAERLKRFVLSNIRLGIAEEKDRLQAEAQLRGTLAERRALLVAWENQRTALNRLMERAWDSEWYPDVVAPVEPVPADLAALEAEALRNSADLRRNRARLESAEATLARRRDAARDQVDMVFSVGNRTLDGDVIGGSISESEGVGGVRLEYRAALDRRGADAEVTQAQIDRSIALRQIEDVQTDLRYTVARLAAEIETAATALEQFQARMRAERAKVDEAVERYRLGRTDTAQLIQFENDYRLAELAAEQQAIELARRRTELDVVRGTLWHDITLPRVEPVRKMP